MVWYGTVRYGMVWYGMVGVVGGFVVVATAANPNRPICRTRGLGAAHVVHARPICHRRDQP